MCLSTFRDRTGWQTEIQERGQRREKKKQECGIMEACYKEIEGIVS